MLFYMSLDLHTAINLYVHSSVNMDTSIKNISVRANYNELVFYSIMAGFDYLDVSHRSFSRIDFR